MATPKPRTGFSSPSAMVNDDDHTAWIITTALLSMVYSILFGLTRAFFSWTAGSTCLYLDNIALTASACLAFVQCSVVLGASSHGLGKTWTQVPQESKEKIQQMYYASVLLFVAALGLSKISVVSFQTRLIATASQRRVFRCAMLLIAIWTAASFLALAPQCNLANPWRLVGQECSELGLRWIIISVFDISFEFTITGLACFFVWELQMTKARKWTVVSAFSYRLLLIIPIAFRLATHDPKGLTLDPTFREVLFVVWTQVEMHLSLILATIPVLRSAIKSFNTSYNSLGPAGSSAAHETSAGTYELSTMGKTSSRAIRSQANGYTNSSGLGSSFTAAAFASSIKQKEISSQPAPDTNSIESHSSEQMTIRKQMSWRIEHNTDRLTGA